MDWKKWFGYWAVEGSKRSASPKVKKRLHLDEIESRVLMSASPLGDWGGDDGQIQDLTGAEFDSILDSLEANLASLGQDGLTIDSSVLRFEGVPDVSENAFDGTVSLVDDWQEDSDRHVLFGVDDNVLDASAESSVDTLHNIVFFDFRVENADQLIQGLGLSNATIVMIDSGSDGISQITDALSLATGVQQVHILSHANASGILLGDTLLSSDNIDQNSQQLASWSAALTDTADILFYGCDIAQTEDGQELLNQISVWTGADVAASDDTTGNAAVGGDWDLEFQVGSIATSWTHFDAMLDSWEYRLDVITGTAGDDILLGTSTADTIDGLAGTDLVIYSGNRSDYSVTLAAGTYTITDLRSLSPDGTDTVTNVENFRFADGDLTSAMVALNTTIIETFENGSLTGWTGGAIVTSNSDFGPFLTSAAAVNSPGTYQSATNGVQDVFKTFALSGNQTSVTIGFTFNRIDSWDGEQFRVWANDVLVSSNTFNQGSTPNYGDSTPDMASGTNVGFGNWDEVTYTYLLTVNTTATSFKLGFGSGINQGWNDEAWGVDNIVIREQASGTTGTYAEGTTGNDSTTGGSLADSYAGGVGNDTYSGLAGRDYVSGGAGTDTISGGDNADFITGGWGADMLSGGLGSDTIDGGEGADTIWGGEANLITNGSFESGTTGWTTSGTVAATSGQGSVLGTNSAAFGSGQGANDGVISQAVTTVAGGTYSLGFNYGAFGAATNQSIRVLVVSGGFTVLDQTFTDLGSNPNILDDYELSFTALGAFTTVSFNDTSSTSTGVDGNIDNVRLFRDDSGVDMLIGGSGDDVIYAGAGNDVVIGGVGADAMFGGAGVDTLSYVSSTSAVTVNLSTSIASGGDAASDVFFGFENIMGSANADTLTGDSNANRIDGGAGNDELRGLGGNDTILGGSGTDVVIYSGNRSDYTISFAGGIYTVVDNRASNNEGTDTVTDVETFRFSDGDIASTEVLTTLSIAAPIVETFENGSLTGWVGGVIVSSSADFGGFLTSATTFNSPNTNANTLGIQNVQDVYKTFALSGDQTSVTIGFTFNRINTWDTEQFRVWVNDVLTSNNTFSGNGTQDYSISTPDQASGTNYGFGGSDDVTNTFVITVNTTATTLKLGFGSGLDESWNNEAWGVDNLVLRENLSGATVSYSEGTTGNDSASFTANENRSYAGGLGNDTITRSGTGNDIFSGGDGADSIDGGLGSDFINGGRGADILVGGSGNDYLVGGEGNDVLYGEGNNLITNGGFNSNATGWTTSGNFSIYSHSGVTEGANAVAFNSGGSTPNAVLSQTATTVIGSNYTLGLDFGAYAAATTQSLRIEVISGGVTVIDTTMDDTGSNPTTFITRDFSFTALGTSTLVRFTDVSTVGNSGSTDGVLDNVRLFEDSAGNDTLDGNAGIDLLYGGRGNDVIDAGKAADNVYAGAGDDIVFNSLGADLLDGGDGTDTLSYARAVGAVNVNLATGANSVSGDSADQISNFENVTGSAFNDTLAGDSGNNTIDGGDGNDTITGGAGNDAIDGGTGSDTVIYSGNWANYTITFNAGSSTYTLVDTRGSSPDGTDTVTGIENFQFADGTRLAADLLNTAPVLDNSGNMTLTTINEDATANAGNTVAAIISSAGGDRITDANASAVEGIAITALTSGNGTWQYSTDGGTIWTAVGSVSNTSALLLRATDSLRFVPNGQNATTGDITFRAWDQYTGTFGSKVTTASNGGTTAFSTATETASISVTAVNDAPTIASSYTYNLTGTNEDTTSSGTLASAILTSSTWADVDTGAVSGLAITGKTGNGAWQYSTDGTTWNTFGAVTSTNALLITSTTQVRYIPDSGNGETATFTYKAWDQTSGTASTNATANYATTASSGGTTAFSTNTDTAQIVVTSVNDAPTVVADTATAIEAGGTSNGTAGTNPTGNVLTNDTDIDAGDILTVTGVAAGTVGSASGNVGSSVAGSYGTITIGSDGSYTYTVDNSNVTVQSLRTSGTTITDTFTYTVQDSGGATSTTQVVLTIQGQNDAPVAVVDNVTATEAGGLNNGNAGSNPTGNVLTNDTDVDSGDTRTVTGVVAGLAGSASGNVASSLAGAYGAITLNANGTYSYVVDNSNAAVQALRTSGDTLDDVFTYTVVDSGGLESTTQMTITIEGANDEQVLATNGGATVAEGTATNVVTSAMLLTTDVDDLAVSLIYSLDSIPTNGTLRLSGTALAAGQTFTQADLNAGSVTYDHDGSQTASDLFDFTVDDGAGTTTSATFNFTVTNVNDAPVITDGPDSANLTETNAGLTSSGALTVTDVDQLDVVTAAVESVVVTGTGASSLPLGLDNAALQNLLSVSPTAILSDTQTTNALIWNFNSGAETFDFLADGETLVLTYTVRANDNAAIPLSDIETVTVTITGTNDRPTITVVDVTGAVIEDATTPTLTDNGSVTFGELDETDVITSSVALTNTATTGPAIPAGLATALASAVTLNQTGTNDGSIAWDFNVANSLVQYLADGETITLTYAVTVTDDSGTGTASTTQDVTVTITGTNDQPAITVVDVVGAVVEDATTPNLTDTGSVTFAEVDETDVLTSSVALTGTATTGPAIPAGLATALASAVTLNQTGTNDGSIAWDFNVANSLVQYLVDGETITLTYTITVTDDSGTANVATTQDITVTITGTNDAPVITIESGDSAAETLAENNATLTTSGTLTTSDIDLTDVVNSTVTSVVADGTTTGLQSNNADLLAMLTSTANVLDATEQTGQLTWNFNSASELFNHLAVGESMTLTYTIEVQDSEGAIDTQTVVITITGANDAPIITVEAGDSAAQTLTETNTTLTSSGTLTVSDVNLSDSVTSRVTGVVASATTNGLALNNAALLAMLSSTANVIDGSELVDTLTWDFNSAAESFDYLAVGETLTLTYTITVTDSQGATDTQDVTITINGTNDVPIFSKQDGDLDTVLIKETDTTLEQRGLITVTDLDLSDLVTASVQSVSVTGDLPGLKSNRLAILDMLSVSNIALDQSQSNNSLEWVFNSGDEYFNYLAPGDRLTIKYTVILSDVHGTLDTQEIEITIKGTNDEPESRSETYVIGQSELLTALVEGVLFNDYDLDQDGLIAVLVDRPGHGTIRFNSDGTFIYSPDRSFFGIDQFTYVANDGTENGKLTTVLIVIQGLDNPIDARNSLGTASSDAVGDSNNEAKTRDSDEEESVDDQESDLESVDTISAVVVDETVGQETDGDVAGQDEEASGESGLPNAQDAAVVLHRLANSRQSFDPAEMQRLSRLLEDTNSLSLSFDAYHLWNLSGEPGQDKDTTELGGQKSLENSLVTGSIVATAGYVLWTLRGGVLMATMMTSLPSWKFIDPLPVLDSFNDIADGEDLDAFDSILDSDQDGQSL